MGSVLEGWAFRMEEGERVLNITLKAKTTIKVSGGFRGFKEVLEKKITLTLTLTIT